MGEDPARPELEVDQAPAKLTTGHEIVVFSTEDWASGAADLFEKAIGSVLSRQGRCVLALSGGTTPASVFTELAGREIEWNRVTLTQVDERVATMESGQRNIVGLRDAFAGLPVRWIPMPVEGKNLVTAGKGFLARLEKATGRRPAVLDLVHLGLGGDGHTASLVPNDPILDMVEGDIGLTGMYQGSQRMTLTRPILERADLVLWLIGGGLKAGAVRQLLRGDQSIPAGQLHLANSLVILDGPAHDGNIA